MKQIAIKNYYFNIESDLRLEIKSLISHLPLHFDLITQMKCEGVERKRVTLKTYLAIACNENWLQDNFKRVVDDVID